MNHSSRNSCGESRYSFRSSNSRSKISLSPNADHLRSGHSPPKKYRRTIDKPKVTEIIFKYLTPNKALQASKEQNKYGFHNNENKKKNESNSSIEKKIYSTKRMKEESDIPLLEDVEPHEKIITWKTRSSTSLNYCSTFGNVKSKQNTSNYHEKSAQAKRSWPYERQRSSSSRDEESAYLSCSSYRKSSGESAASTSQFQWEVSSNHSPLSSSENSHLSRKRKASSDSWRISPNTSISTVSETSFYSCKSDNSQSIENDNFWVEEDRSTKRMRVSDNTQMLRSVAIKQPETLFSRRLPSDRPSGVSDTLFSRLSTTSPENSQAVYDEFSSEEKKCWDEALTQPKNRLHFSSNQTYSTTDSTEKRDSDTLFSRRNYAERLSSTASENSQVVYNECSSEKVKYWDQAPTQPKNRLNFSSNQTYEPISDDSDSTTDSTEKRVSTRRSLGDIDLRIRLKAKRAKKFRLYNQMIDLETISEMIDYRLIGKHDSWIHSSLKKIFILGDSHTRFLVNGIRQILPGFRSYTICKPSAKTGQVFDGVDKSISELTKKDFLIIFCGTNDMWSDSTCEAERCFAKNLESIKNTNIIVCSVPQNYSETETSYVQRNIERHNAFLKKIVKECKNACLVNLNRLKRKDFFTQHGLHFNGAGKVKICEVIAHKLVDILDKINSGWSRELPIRKLRKML